MSTTLLRWKQAARRKHLAELKELRARWRTGWGKPTEQQARVIRRHWLANNFRAMLAYCFKYRLDATQVTRETPSISPAVPAVDKGHRLG